MSHTKEIRHIQPNTTGKMLGALYAICGVIFGCLFAISVIIAHIHDQKNIGISVVIVVLAPLSFGLIYGVLGYIAGLITGFLYNFIAKWVGGIKIELQ